MQEIVSVGASSKVRAVRRWKRWRGRGKLVDFTNNTLKVFASATVIFRYPDDSQQAPRMISNLILLLSIQVKRFRGIMDPKAEPEKDLVRKN